MHGFPFMSLLRCPGPLYCHLPGLFKPSGPPVTTRRPEDPLLTKKLLACYYRLPLPSAASLSRCLFLLTQGANEILWIQL